MSVHRFRVPHIIFLAPTKIQGGKTNEQKENRMAVRQTVEKAVIRDEQNRRIQSAATNPVKEVLKIFHTTLRGLEADTVSVNRSKYGTNKVTHEKKKSLAKRVAGAFINPLLLFCFAFCVCFHDYGYDFPVFSLFWKRTGGL